MPFNTGMNWAILLTMMAGAFSLCKTALSIRDHVRDGLRNVVMSCDGLRKDVDHLTERVGTHELWLVRAGFDRRLDERRGGDIS